MPTNLRVVPGDHQVAVSWAAPSSDGGRPILGYILTVSTAPVERPPVVLSPQTLGATVTGLANGTAYTFRVHATNADGSGPDASKATTPAAPPSIPTAIQSRKHPIRLNWVAPTFDGGVPLTGYVITPYVGTTAGTPVTVSAQQAAGTVAHVPENNTYTFSVAATNGVSIGPGVVTTAMTIGCGIPGLPELPINTTAFGLVTADLNGDGIVDEVVADNTQFLVYLGIGDGSFVQVDPCKSGMTYGPCVVGPGLINTLSVGDLNGDGIPDLVVGASSGAIVYFGVGDGTFQSSGGFSTPNPVRSIAFGDFNGDGKMDLAASGTSVSLALGMGTSGLLAPATVVESSGGSIVAADLDGDGITDLVTTSGRFEAKVLWGAPVNPLGTSLTLTLGGQAYAAAVGDFNNDGRPDIVTANWNTGNVGNVSVLLANGTRSFAPSTSLLPTINGPSQIVAGDFNGDGKLDIATGSGEAFSVLLGHGDGQFDSHIEYGFQDGPSFGTLLKMADVNGDGFPDMVLSGIAGRVLAFRGNGDGSFVSIRNYALGQSPTSGVAGDFNKDGKMDVATFDGFTNVMTVFLGNGDGTFNQVATTFPTGTDSGFAVVADFNEDGKADVAETEANSVALLLGNGDGTFAPLQATSVGGGPTRLLLSDINGDKHEDLVVLQSGPPNGIDVLLGSGAGTFTVGVVTTNAAGVVVADFNNDGHPDIATSVGGQPTIFFGKGDGTFTATPISSTCAPQLAADFNGDGILDLVDSVNGWIRVCPGITSTTFGPPILLPVIGTSTLDRVVDIDGDGLPDILAIGSGSDGSVILALNDGVGGFSMRQFAEGQGGFMLTPAVADFNNDGKLDVGAVTPQGGLHVMMQHCFR